MISQIATALILLSAAMFVTNEEAQAGGAARFIGAGACAGCHAPEAERWTASHHALAMQKATEATVLGDFANATLTHHGVTTTFSRDGDKFMVRTEGPDSAPHDYEIAYTFGVAPLHI
jgi:cytochrome c553